MNSSLSSESANRRFDREKSLVAGVVLKSREWKRQPGVTGQSAIPAIREAQHFEPPPVHFPGERLGVTLSLECKDGCHILWRQRQ